MKKKLVLSMALLSSVVMGGTTVTANAAEFRAVQIQAGGCYEILDGDELERLQMVLDEFCTTINNAWDNCPDTEQPETETPGAGMPEQPETEAPGADIPEQPETETPGVGMPEQPETEAPGAGIPEQPETEAPGVGIPEQPDTEMPDVQETEAEIIDTEGAFYGERILELVNEERAKAGLPALTLQADITAAANIRAREITQLFSHTRPDGNNFSSVLKEQGIVFRGSGENIAYGQKTPEQVMEGWMNSEGHRANILNANYKNLGVGYYQDEKGVNYWVQLFTY